MVFGNVSGEMRTTSTKPSSICEYASYTTFYNMRVVRIVRCAITTVLADVGNEINRICAQHDDFCRCVCVHSRPHAQWDWVRDYGFVW